jgi:hypothetical protein
MEKEKMIAYIKENYWWKMYNNKWGLINLEQRIKNGIYRRLLPKKYSCLKEKI